MRSWCRRCGRTASSSARQRPARPRPSCRRLSGGTPAGSLRRLHDFRQPPALRRAQRTCLDDADDVPDLGGVLLVVRVELDAPPDDLLVSLVRADHVDLDDDRLVHRARDDDAAALLAPAAVVVRLRLADDRLALSARRVARPRLLRTQPARETLAFLLRLGLGRGGRLRLGGRLPSSGSLRLLSGSLFGSRFLSGRLLSRRLLSRRLLNC